MIISPAAPEHILLVDDRPANLLVYNTILEELGQVLVSATSGEEALKLVLKHDFAVILLDVNMPTMNGFETASLIRKRKKSATTPIIFLTAFTDEMNIIQGYASGAVDFMPTPVVPEVLKAKIRVFIELSQMRRQAALQAEERVRREAAEAAARTSAFLARASAALARVQTRDDFMATLARLPLPDIAHSAAVYLRHGNQLQATDWAVADGGREPDDVLPDQLEAGVNRTLVEGRANVHHLKDGDHIHYLPLPVQGQAEGVLVLVTEDETTGASPLTIDLLGRAASALENIMLMEQIREADRRKDEFLGMLAHELRNPLGPIYNCLQLQKIMPPGDPRGASIRETMDRQVRHMSRLIDDLLDATRLAHGKILLRSERCDLVDIVRQTAEDYRSIVDASGLSLKLELPRRPVWIDGDPTRLLQVVGNLLHNANKFSHPGGEVRVSLQVDGPLARIKVSDQGIGIEPAMLGHIFDVFRQAEQGLDRSRGGLGLGLALVRGLAELHGGHVEASSRGVNRGAEFSVWLPLAEAAAKPLKDDTQSISPAAPLRILLIEDNVDAAESARMLLSHQGHAVDIAFDAESGLSKARDMIPDVILCDIGLPGMDGYQIIRRIREDKRLSPVYAIALTGYGREADKDLAVASGFDLHLTKPIDWPTLASTLSRAGGRPAEARAIA